MELTSKHIRLLLDLLRDHIQARAEVRLLSSALLTAETVGFLPKDWAKDHLEAARLTPEYQSIVREYDAEFERAENAADSAEVEKLLERVGSEIPLESRKRQLLEPGLKKMSAIIASLREAQEKFDADNQTGNPL